MILPMLEVFRKYSFQRIICPKCKEEGTTSTVRVPQDAYTEYSDNGVYYGKDGIPLPHNKDESWWVHYANCSNGHTFKVKESRQIYE
jgi:hypothetical protein